MSQIDPTIFKSYDIRGKYPAQLDEEAAYRIGRAYAQAYRPKRILIAKDFRLESKRICDDFIRGVRQEGVKVYDLGVDSTPVMFFGVGNKKLDGGTMVTASHNPQGYTGLKMCGQTGVLIGLSTGLDQIRSLAQADMPDVKGRLGGYAQINLSADYFRFIKSFVNFNTIKGFKLVVDNSSGSGARLLDYVMVRLNSKVTKMNFRPHDKYPDHDLNPMLAKNQQSIQQEVKKVQADLGILYDGDADRCVFINHLGQVIPPFYLNCLLVKIVLDKLRDSKVYHPKIVIDARLPKALSVEIQAHGGVPVITPAGYSNIVNLMYKRKIYFGCENSGHYMFNFKFQDKTRNYVYGDAIIPVLLVLEYLAEHALSLKQALSGYLKKYAISGELNFKLKQTSFEQIKVKILRKYQAYKIAELDGISVDGGSWFFNLRPSHTEPLVRLNIEALTKSEVVRIKQQVVKLIS